VNRRLHFWFKQLEIEEVESRNEEYPLLLSFLELLTTLIDSPVPAKLGAGFRVPGFEPYLDFLRDSVLLRFASRAYKRPADKVLAHTHTFSALCPEVPGWAGTRKLKPIWILLK